jgi:CRISPR-associated Csx3 family protein
MLIQIPTGHPTPEALLTVQQRPLPGAQLLEFSLPDAYLDIAAAGDLRLPPCRAEGAVLSGKLPHWLWTALVRACDAAWVAVVQPQEHGAVVVKSQVREPSVGTVIPVPHVVP